MTDFEFEGRFNNLTLVANTYRQLLFSTITDIACLLEMYDGKYRYCFPVKDFLEELTQLRILFEECKTYFDEEFNQCIEQYYRQEDESIWQY